ncbi:MAG: hypothetical protein ABJG41_01340 [Cyclobacteriaceae bacterium]
MRTFKSTIALLTIIISITLASCESAPSVEDMVIQDTEKLDQKAPDGGSHGGAGGGGCPGGGC